MEVPLATARAIVPWHAWRTTLATTGLILLWTIASLLVARLASGALTATPNAWVLLQGSLGVAALGVLVRSMQQSTAHSAVRIQWLALAAVVVIAGVFTAVSRSALGDLAIWLPLIAVELTSCGWTLWERQQASYRAVPPGQVPGPAPPADKSDGLGVADEDAERPLPESTLQRFERIRTAEGGETFAGQLRAEFAVGQRSAALHVAFCPPFAHTPEIYFEQCDGPSVRIKLGQVFPYAARLDLRLSEAATTASSVVVEFVAMAPPTEADAE